MNVCSKGKMGLIACALFFALFYLLSSVAEARVGGGRSFGSRGSRSFSSSPSSPSSPSRSYNTPSRPSPSAAPQSQPGGFMRSMAGGLLGGMAGALLFSSLGFGHGAGGFGGGIGLMNILLLGAILYGIYWFIKRRRQAATAMNAPMAYGSPDNRDAFNTDSYAPPIRDIPPAGYEAGDGLSAIRREDHSFDEKRFKDSVLDNFFSIQGAWANRDMSGVRNLLTDDMYKTIQQDADELRAKHRINKLDNIAVRSVEITESWQEGGRDFITVRFYANLLDYTVDEISGEVLAGSRKDPVKFVEFWTFARPSGNNPWRLSAIQQES